ncbi:Protein CBG17086 [Caenorhabditis briggsae]|uniref:Protein CBG17086 n=1 Tax=Caenorhabditis briggsae TaxID=6238 RepID=A8XQF0_CAEBR|nr:Protein CBG17086 [Caenorhabditis briggsae]CAP34875.2 Protein CBG17086 [Caenorhabditis briggsae]
MNSTNFEATPLFFDTAYLLRYLILILSAFGLVTNIIHIGFLSRILRSYPISIGSLVISISDFLMFTTRFTVETVEIVTFVDHRNCFGYVNRADLLFKFLTESIYFISDNVINWMIISMCFLQIFDFKRIGESIWTFKTTATVALAAVFFAALFVFLQIISAGIVILQLPYSECSQENLYQNYMENEKNWMTDFANTMNFITVFSIFLERGLNFIFVFYLIKLNWKSKENVKKSNCKLICFLHLSFVVTFIFYEVVNIWLFETKMAGLDNQDNSILPTEITILIKCIGATFRPFLILFLSLDYQKTVREFFIISTGQSTVKKQF